MKYLAYIRKAQLALVAPLTRLAEREGTEPNDDMRATRVVKAILGVK